MQQTKRVIELVRVSTSGQAGEDRASIPSQKAINRRTAEAYGLSIVRTIEMSDVSGTAVLLTPEIQGMVRLMQDPEVHGVVAREFSRLMRPENFLDYALLQTFSETKTILYLPEGPIDFSNKMGRVYGVMQAAWAGAQRIEFLENGWNAKEEKRQQGGFAQSAVCLPFGVTFKDNKWSYTGDAERVKAAFRMFLSGETSYTVIGRKLSLQPYNIKVFLRNPIYTGWRVIDKKRDSSPAGKYATKDGRQGDRRKIQRAPEDVIRVRVMEPLVSESQFRQAQQLMEMKRRRSWRSNDNYEHRFTYNGFLLCGACQGTIYTKYRRCDYYVCKQKCGAPYMRRERLEPIIDSLFADKLVSTEYAARIVRALRKRQPQTNVARVTTQLTALAGKRERILGAYFEGVINPTERDMRLAEIERERTTLSNLISSERPEGALTAARLAKIFRPFVRYAKLNRESKRRMLATLTTEIVAAKYEVQGIFIGLGIGQKENRTAAGSVATESRIWLPVGLAA